jgi:TatD DNase family protein
MIDTHCHLEQAEYSKDRDSVIEKCRKELNAVITSSAHPSDFNLTMELVDKYPNFVYATASIHPLYIKEITEQDAERYFELIRKNRKRLVAIGECGTDYWHVREAEWREKQRKLFIRLIELAEELKLPLVIHSRNGTDEANAVEDAIKILEDNGAKRVQMHMFSSRQLLQRVLKNGWMVSVNTLLTRSKSVKKVVRDCPLEQMMLETDAPWLGLDEDGNIREPRKVRNDPTAVKIVAREIAEIKKAKVDDVDKQTTENAIKFFSLPRP